MLKAKQFFLIMNKLRVKLLTQLKVNGAVNKVTVFWRLKTKKNLRKMAALQKGLWPKTMKFSFQNCLTRFECRSCDCDSTPVTANQFTPNKTGRSYQYPLSMSSSFGPTWYLQITTDYWSLLCSACSLQSIAVRCTESLDEILSKNRSDSAL